MATDDQQQPLASTGLMFEPGSVGYVRATSPQNSLAQQHPALVAAPVSAEQVSWCVRYAAAQGLTVVAQATGHGATGELGADVLLLDTSGLDQVLIDPDRRAARAGAGCTWGDVNSEAYEAGLLGRAGSALSVGIAGFSFGAGAGWLTRPHGLASGALTAVDYVDGHGAIRRAADDAADALDRDVIWACRGGGGAGIAVTLEFGLVEVEDLWAGYLLWPLDALEHIVAAWTHSLPRFGPALATSLAILQAPPSPLIPAQLHGHKVVHLALASSAGGSQAAALTEALGRVPEPALNTWGPADLARLSQIHLDPPSAEPGFGVARWLTGSFPTVALTAFRTAAAENVQMFEVRNVANSAPVLPGALDRAPGPFMLHAVGAPEADDLTPLEAAFSRILAAVEPADTGLAVGSWSDGRVQVPDALPARVRARVAAIGDRVDPHHVLARPAVSAAPAHGRKRTTGELAGAATSVGDEGTPLR